MAEASIWKRIADFFISPPSVDPVEMKEVIGEDDSVVLSVPTVNSTYKPRAWIDRNTFFRSLLILTEKRLLILKSGSAANVLRDIELDTITHHRFGSAKKKGLSLEIKTVEAEDVIRFHRQYEKEFEKLAEKFPEVLGKKLESSAAGGETVFCMYCGMKIPAQSVFCSFCGKRIRI